MAELISDYENLECKNCLKNCPSFNLLTSSELDSLNNASMEVTFREGEIIYKQGTPLTHMVIVHTGFGKIYIESPKGRNLMLTYTKSYELNGGVGVFIDRIHHSSLMAVTDSETCFIEINAFDFVLRNNEAFMAQFLKEYSQRVLHNYHQFVILTQKNVEGRMAESILYLKNQVFNNGSIKHVSKQDLAELTAMTKESVIRVLKDFKEDGLIDMFDHTIDILDQKSLEQIMRHG